MKQIPWRRVLTHAAPALILLLNDLTNSVRGINNPTVTTIVTGVGALLISLLHNYEKPAS